MYLLRTSLKRFIVAFFLLGCGALLVGLGGDVAVAASPPLLNNTPSPTLTGTPPTSTPSKTATNTRTPTNTIPPTNTRTPTATPDCDDWRLWPNPSGGQLINPLYGVAAAAPNDVWTVGFTGGYGSTNPHVLIERWDGTQWNLMQANDPGILQAVAVVAPDDVWAVGYYEDPARNLTMHWDGTSWSIVPSPYVEGVGNSLYGVAAAGPDDVWAVGTVQNQGRVLRWDGTQWSVVPIPEFDYSFLLDVAVAGPDDVWAVGSVGYYDHYNLILHWDGTQWTQVASPSAVSYRNRLNAISVVSANDIWAAGWATEGQSTFSGTILHWNGTQWSIAPISGEDNPETSGSTQLYGIAAASSTEAWAVGWELDWTIRRNVIIQWDGNSWTRLDSPDPSSYFNQLEGVAAVAPGEAWAVGHYGTDSSGQYGPEILRYGPQCASPTPTVTGTPPTATSTGTSTSTGTATNTSTPTDTATAIPTVCGTLLTEGFESGSLGQFTNAVPTCVPGGCGWRTSTISPHTGSRDAFAPDVADVSDQRLVLSNPIVPTSGSLLTFWHSYDFEGFDGSYFDGGVLEASTNGGTNWFDLGSNIISGGYVGTISFQFENPLAGREAWGGNSGGYIQSVVNLSPYAGQNLLFRFREGTDNSLGANGWRIDDIVVTGGAACPSVTVVPATSTAVAPTGTQVPATATATSCPGLTINGSLTLDDPTQAGRLNTLLKASTCSNPRGCPGAVETVPRHYDAYAFVNTSNSTACFTVEVTASCLDDILIHSAAYLDDFDPQNLCQNYLADVGPGVLTSSQYSFTVPAGARFVIVVNELAPNLLCPSYTLQVTGPACPVPATPVPTSTSILPTITLPVPTLTALVSTATSTPEETSTPIAGECTLQFSDVPEGSTFYMYVRCLACRGIIAGYPDGSFRPDGLITRGQLAKIASNAAGLDGTPSGQTFEDVPESDPFYMYVGRAAARGVLNGYPCGGESEPCGPESRPYFRPYASTTRGQLAKVVANAAGMMEAEVPTEDMFADVPAGSTFYDYVQMLTSHGAMGGYPCGGEGEPCDTQDRPYFRPYNNVTRGQASKIVAGAFYPNCQTP
ncbi:MAG TPA: S-layer homology domain-containing protein [Chloroflexia bacterium]|nr:S-layer homology domain-containing protein [Chloroflexia bacterium]